MEIDHGNYSEEEGNSDEQTIENENDSEDEEPMREDLQGPENYVKIGGVEIFFNNLVDQESVSGLLSINNICSRRIYFNDELEMAINMWSEFEDLENILNTNGYVLKILDLASFSDNGKKGIYFIDNDKHYFILKRLSNDGPLFLLDPIKEKPEICNPQKWSYFKNLLNKHQDGRVKLF